MNTNDPIAGSYPKQRQRWLLRALCAVLIALLMSSVAPAYAAEEVDALPFVNNFATARFKLLVTVGFGDHTSVAAYGAGETVMPDRTSAWLGSSSSSDLTYVIQIGSTVYQRTGAEAWRETTGASLDSPQFLPVSAQFNLLQEKANAILNYGPENVGNVPTTRYQVWISGERALELAGVDIDDLPESARDVFAKAVYKYDFWIGTQDSFLHQQNVELTLPGPGGDADALTISSLTTFYDINDPNISVNAPI